MSDAATPAPDGSKRRAILAGIAVVAVIAVCACAAIASKYVASLAVRVCTSSMTDRIANRIVHAYAAQNRVWPYHYVLTAPGDDACDVRFMARASGSSTPPFARDGVVVVVQPQNAVGRIDVAQLRDVLAGRIGDWSQLHGRPGPIAVALPDDASDEARDVSANVMGSGSAIGPHVVRILDAAQIVRWVASPSGARSIGIVPFSVASPAKVIMLGSGPAPSTLSIADGRYPLALGLTVSSDFRFPSTPAAGLMRFATSAGASTTIVGAGLVRTGGP